MTEMPLKFLVALAVAGLAAGCAAAPSAGPPVDQVAGGTASAAASSTSPSGGAAPSAKHVSCPAGAAGAAAGSPSSSGQSPALAAIQFVGPSHGWVAGAGRILASSNGGRTWTRQYTGPAVLDQVDFIDGSHGWAAGGDALLRTTDGGAAWTPLAEPCAGELASIHFVSASLGYAVVARTGGGPYASAVGGSLARTTDGGVTWTTVARAPKNPQVICFANPSEGYLGTPGRIWRTIDGGQNWTLALREPPPSSDTPTVECAGPSAAWVLFLGQNAAMEHAPYLAYASPDGRAWHALFEEQYTESGLRPGLKLPEGPGSYPGPFSAINSGTAAFVGYTPPVGYGVAPLEMVSDRGHVLTRAGNVATINEPFAAAFLSSARGWVAGENLRTHVFSIQVTTNSGRTWATQYTTR
jgi:photosystem II stability/assembly factor-like uncharacterized protein